MERVRLNVEGKGRRSTKADAWNGMLIAILTTQQKSGRGSKPTEILQSGHLSWRRVNRDPSLITRYIKGFRFNTIKRKRLTRARVWLHDNWRHLRRYQSELDQLPPSHPDRYELECKAADFLLGRNGGLEGVGPKQARNFWQYLGYTVWTIPLDSRVQKILSEPPFAIASAGRGLGGARYVRVERSVIDLCKAAKRAKAYPVLLDSALFNMEGLIRDLVGFSRADENGFVDGAR